MILLTAQYVRSDRLDVQGINAHLHRRLGKGLPPWSTEERVLASQIDEIVAESGVPDASTLQVPPGGNSVLAFLDVVAYDDTASDELVALLNQGPTRREQSHIAWQNSAGTGAAHYFVSNAMELNWLTVFGLLRNQLLSLFKRGQGDGPLRVIAERSEAGERYRLDQDSMLRMARLHGAGWQAPTVQVSSEDAEDFRRLNQYDMRVAIIDVLTGLDATYVKALGGIVFVRPSGEPVFQWPPDQKQSILGG